MEPKRQRVDDPWDDPFGPTAVRAVVMVSLLQMVTHLRADDGKKGLQLAMELVQPLIQEKAQQAQKAMHKELSGCLQLRGKPWSAVPECQVVLDKLRVQVLPMCSTDLFGALAQCVAAVPLSHICTRMLSDAHMRRMGVMLVPEYRQHLSSISAPPALHARLPRQLLFAITGFLSASDVLLRLGSVNRAWFMFSYWNVFAMAGSARVYNTPTEQKRWQFLQARQQTSSVVKLYIPFAGVGGLPEALDYISATRLQLVTIDVLHMWNEALAAFLDRHPLVSALVVRNVSMFRVGLLKGESQRWPYHKLKMVEFQTQFSGSTRDLHNDFWLPSLDVYPALLRVRVNMPVGSEVGLTASAIRALFVSTAARMLKHELPGVERIEIMLVAKAAKTADDIRSIFNPLCAMLQPIPRGVAISAVLPNQRRPRKLHL